MQNLTQQRCFHHAQREAVARCPECSRFFCRECITEHEDRVICASCLKKLVDMAAQKKHRLQAVGMLARSLLGFLLLWLVFYSLGRGLLSLPSSFHDGTPWEELTAPEP